jgi:hypothetical protein
MALYRAVPIRLGPLPQSAELSRWRPCLELLVPQANDCSARIAQFDSLSLTPRGAPLRRLYVHCAPEAVVRLFRPRQLGPVVQSVSEELAGFQWRCAAFDAVDDPLQLSFAETNQRCHHPFRRVRTFHRHDEVIGISRKLVSTGFLVKISSIMVRS